MPIISCQTLENKTYRIAVTLGNGMLENIVVTKDGLYSIYYIRDGKNINHNGHIVNVVQNKVIPSNNYILFDYSEDNSNRKERIYFHQIQFIRDITPNNAYQIALEHGFVGTVEDWLESMRGLPGKDAYELAVDCGFEGTIEDFIESLVGERGLSAYDIAVQYGYKGTEAEWVASLQGVDGKSAYEIAIEHGFEGTIEDWMAQNGDITSLKKDIEEIRTHIQWNAGM